MRATPFSGLTTTQRRDLAQVKRFLELLLGKEGFSDLLARKDWGRARQLMSKAGLEHGPEAFAPLFRNGVTLRPSPEECADFPLLLGWLAFQQQHASMLEARVGFEPENGPFREWRDRQLNRLRQEIGFDRNCCYAPLMAFELSSGCSVQCSFCGFDAPALTSMARHHDTAALWRGILRTAKRLIGPAAGEAALYHATEPADNPDYFLFMRDFVDIHETLPQTTTAAPLRSPGWTRTLLAMRQETPSFSDRFSLLAPADLDAVHHAFGPEDLLPVQLLFQYGDRLNSLARTGRNLHGDGHSLPPADTGTNQSTDTIECLCGFLVNLPQRTLSLISPCMATAPHPNGHKTHETTTFHDPQSFEQAISSMIQRHMPTHMQGADAILVNKGLEIRENDGKLWLESRYMRHEIGSATPELSELLISLQQGTRLDAACALAATAGHSIPGRLALLDQMFRAGLIDVIPHGTPG